MPKFDHPKDRDLWETKAHDILRAVVMVLDGIFYIYHWLYPKSCPYDCVEVAPQGFWRPKGKGRSFHPIYQAIDVRVKGLTRIALKLIETVLHFIVKLDYSNRIQYVYEKALYDESGECIRGEHIHVEIDTKKDGVYPV